MSVYSSAAGHGGGVAGAGRAGGRVSLGDRRVDVSPGSGARGLHAGRPLGGRRTLSRVRAAGAVAAETTRLAGWLAVTVETGERHPSAHEHSVNSVSAESRRS